MALVSVTATDDAGDSAADAALITVGGTTPVVPTLVPGSATVGEGDEATTTVDVPVTLSEPTTVPVTATWHTLEAPSGGATQAQADVDYVATSGTVTFAPGETEATVALEVIGDVTDEPNEFVLVAFDAPTNAELGGFYGLGSPPSPTTTRCRRSCRAPARSSRATPAPAASRCPSGSRTPAARS
ncbi:MAG: Calx-beta domain-containing protein [Acidimicrobiales bacterium]